MPCPELGGPCPRNGYAALSTAWGPSHKPPLSCGSETRQAQCSCTANFCIRSPWRPWGLRPSLVSSHSLPAFLSRVDFHLLGLTTSLLSLGLIFALCNLVCFGYCINPPSPLVSAARDISTSLFPPEDIPLSRLDTAIRSGPALNMQETEDCIFAGTVPENLTESRQTTTLKPTQWAEHVNDQVQVQGTLKAYQTGSVAGRERQFALTFKLPDNLATSGKATLTMNKDWDGSSHQWSCTRHTLRVIRLSDDKYLQGRNASSETSDTVTWDIGSGLTSYSTDLGSLTYGKSLQGKPIHLLFRENSERCLSSFATPNEPKGPVLTVEVAQTTPVDAVYGSWEPFSKCRASCITPVNYQCRKRNCTPGINTGTPCRMDLMVDKQPCTDMKVSAACTCATLNEEQACPEFAVCDDSVANNVSCRCPGVFMRESVATKTICTGSSSADEGFGLANNADVGEESNSLLVLWIILGVFGFVVVVGCAVLLCVKKRPMRDEDLLNVNIDPQTGGPASGMGDMGASMFWGQSPAVPMGGPQPPFPPGAGMAPGMAGGRPSPGGRPSGYAPLR